MKKMLVALCASMMLMTTVSHAAAKPASEKQMAQRQRMTDCNAEAKTKALKGADRKSFMSTCLSGGAVTAAPAAAPAAAAPAAAPAAAAPAAKMDQKDKMKACNADAKTKALKGDERKTFMSSCLSG
jgi:hypothetical protein